MNLVNPYELARIKTGFDLLNFYKVLIEKFKKDPPTILQDGFSVNLKFQKTDGKNFITMGDHGKPNIIDIQGFTYIDINKRFINNKHAIKAYKALFNIFANASEVIYPTLKKLKLFGNNILLKCKFVPDNTIIIESTANYTLKGNDRIFSENLSQKELISTLVQELQPYAANIGFEVITPIKTNLLPEHINASIFDNILNEVYSIVIKPNYAMTKTIRNWLRGCKNPGNKKIKIGDEKVSIFSKSLFFKILKNTAITDIIGNRNYKKELINAFIIQLLNQALSQTIIEHLTSPLDNLPIKRLQYGIIQLTGDDIIDRFSHVSEEDEQRTVSYISNPPHKTSDWGAQVPMMESWDLETEPHYKTFVNYIVEPRPFLKNDYDVYKQLSDKFMNHLITIMVPSDNDIKFDKIKKTILAFGIPEEEIEQYPNVIDPKGDPLGNSDRDKVVFILSPKSKKHLKYIKKYLRDYNKADKMLPYFKHAYYDVVDTPALDIIEYNKIKNYEDFINSYKKFDDNDKFKLLDAMYGNSDLKSILDTF